MRHLLKYVQRGGLVSALLIGGVLGGLLAPLPSDAGTPTLTLLIDGQPLVRSTGETVTGNSILGSSVALACSGADSGLGYTACYSILTSTTTAYRAGSSTRLYRIQNAPGATARLRVGDNVGQDNFSLIGVQFVPVNSATQPVTTVTNWGAAADNTNEQHILTLTMRNKFDSAVNVNNATGVVVGGATVGQLAYGMRSGGEFRTQPLSTPVPTTTLFCTTGATTARCSTVGDRVVYTGRGIFSGAASVDILSPGAPTATNSLPLSLTVGAGSANSSIVSFDGLTNPTVGQVSLVYPKFNCVDVAAPTKCQPDITLTMTATLKGPDTFVLVNGQDAFSAICTTVDNGKLTRYAAVLTRIVRFLTWIEQFHPSADLRAIIAQINVFLATFNAPTDPTCPGGMFINFQFAINAAIDQIAFTASGAVPADPAPTGTITINKHLDLSCDGPCSGLTPVPFTFSIRNTSDDSIVTETLVTTDGTGNGSTVLLLPDGAYNVIESPQSGWTLTQSSCNPGPNTNNVFVSAGNNVTCSFTNSPATSGDLGIRLTWGALPFDLDSHLYIPNGGHVAYFSQGSLVVSPYAELDLDDVTGFGPEVITVVRRMKGTYQYFVHNFSNTFAPGMTGSPAKVELIRNGITTSYSPPPTGEGTNRYWHVFNVDVNSDCVVSIVPINAWLASPPLPVTTSENLCP